MVECDNGTIGYGVTVDLQSLFGLRGPHNPTQHLGSHSEKKTEIFLIYKEIQMGCGCKVIYEEGPPNI
jgi:hypothetical protein